MEPVAVMMQGKQTCDRTLVERLISFWILTSHQPHRVASGWLWAGRGACTHTLSLSLSHTPHTNGHCGNNKTIKMRRNRNTAYLHLQPAYWTWLNLHAESNSTFSLLTEPSLIPKALPPNHFNTNSSALKRPETLLNLFLMHHNNGICRGSL